MTRVAVAQVGSRVFDTPATMQRLRDVVADAAAKQVEFLVFPEAFIGGYPKGYDFGVRLGLRSSEGREEFRRLFESAVEPARTPVRPRCRPCPTNRRKSTCNCAASARR